MKNCSTVFNTNIKKEDSILYKDILKQFKSKEEADYMYDNIIMSNIYQENSFLQWLDSKGDFMETSQGEPAIDEFMEWLNFLAKESSLRKTFITNSLSTTVDEFISISEGLTSYLPEVLKDKGLTFNDWAEGLVDSRNIRSNALNKMLTKLQENVNDELAIDSESEFAKRVQLIIDEIKDNKRIFFDAYNGYLDSTMKITFENTGEINENKVLDENIQDVEENKQTKDTAFDKSSNEFSAKENAPKAIKLMVGSLTDSSDLNSLGLPKIVDYNKVMNLLHDELSNVPGDIDNYLKIVKNASSRIESLDQLIDQLNFYKGEFKYSEDPEQKFREQRLRTQFVNHFEQTKYDYTLHIKDRDKVYRVIDSNLDKSRNIKLMEWESTFKQQISENPNFYTEENFKTRIKGMNRYQLLSSLGIHSVKPHLLPSSIILDIERYGMDTFQDFLTIYDKKYDRRDKKKVGVRAKLLKLAENEVRNDDSIVELQHYNAEGKLVYGISLKSYLSDRVSKLSHFAGNEQELKTRFPELYNDPYIGSSTFATWIKAGHQMNVGISTGLKNDNKNKASETSNLNKRDILIQKVYSLLQEGQYNFMRAAERKIENFFFFTNQIGENITGREALIIDGKNDAILYFINHLYDEVHTNMLYDLGMDIQNVVDFNVNSTRVFELKNGSNLIKKIGYDKLLSMSVDDMLENKAIVDFVRNKVDEIIDYEKEYFNKQVINKNDVLPLVKEYGSMDGVIEQYALNGYIANLEISKIFTGDPLLYGSPSNFFKRMSMLNSTKEATRTDEESNNFIAGLTNNMEKAHGYEDGRTGSTIRTITIADVESNMNSFSKEEQDTIKEILGTVKGYNNINEADGFAYITYDEYRIMKIRYADWDIIDEELYQKITTQKDYVIEDKYFNRIRPDKSQFVGKLHNNTTDEFNMVAGRKFSFMPLIPGLIKEGSVLDSLNKDMLANGVGMAFMESASKFGNRVGKNNKPLNQLYDSQGNYNISIEEDVLDILDYSQMGNQLKIDKKEKREQTESTQKRKLNLSNFYEGGNLKELEDKSLPGLLEEYDSIQREKVNRAYKTLETRLGFDLENRNEQLREFVRSLTNMGRLQGFTTNELLALQELTNLPFLDILPNKQRVENFIMAKLRNNAISQKRKGASMAQASNLGFELPGGLNRHDLKFYRLSEADKNGDKRLLPMEVYAPLPRELMDYVSEVYNNGKGLTISALEKFNEDIAKDNVEYEKTGKKTTLTNLTMFVGFRIPNQGPSSSDVGKVKAYYPPHVGSMVVVPKALVAKTGSDFDIDKLNMYLPEINVTKDTDGKIAESFFRKYMDRGMVVKALRDEEIGYDYYDQSYDTLKEWFTEGILRNDRDNIKNSRYKLYNELYKTMLGTDTKGKIGLSYITPGQDIDQMSNRELNNKALENEIAITLSKDNWKQLLTPLDTNNIKKIVESLRKLTDWKEETNMSDIFLPGKNIDKMIEFLSGKSGVGQVAVHNTNHILAQKAGLKMKAIHHYFGMEQDGNIDISRITNEDGILISEILSELLTAYVDIAKDPYILDINAVTEVANTMLMMVRQGLPLKKLFYFINQPIIKEYLRVSSIENSLSNDYLPNKDKNVIAALRIFGIQPNLQSMIYHTEDMIEYGTMKETARKGKIYTDFNVAEMERDIAAGGKNKNLQLKALDVFLEMQRQSRLFQEMIRSTSPDTQGFKTFTILENQSNLREEVSKSNMFENYDRMFDNFIGDFWNIKSKYKTGISEYFLAQLPGYKPQLDDLKSMIGDTVRNAEIEEKQILKVENDFIMFLMSSQGVIDHQRDFPKLFQGNKSVPKLLKKLQRKYADNEQQNSFLDMALPLINERQQGYDSVKPKAKKISGLERESIFPAYKELGDPLYREYFNTTLGLPPNTDFYKEMNKYFLMQTGINNSPYNMVNFMPATDYIQMVKDVILKASDGSLDINAFTSLYGEDIGLYVLNNLSLFYKKDRKRSFKVNYHPNNGKFSAAIPTPTGQLRIWQRGANNLLDYGALSIKVNEPVQGQNNTLDDNNPLNCASNKK